MKAWNRVAPAQREAPEVDSLVGLLEVLRGARHLSARLDEACGLPYLQRRPQVEAILSRAEHLAAKLASAAADDDVRSVVDQVRVRCTQLMEHRNVV